MHTKSQQATPEEPSQDEMEERVLDHILADAHFSVLKRDFNLKSTHIKNYVFTIYRYNILQLAVYFHSYELINSICEDQPTFTELLNLCTNSKDSLYDIIMYRPSL